VVQPTTPVAPVAATEHPSELKVMARRIHANFLHSCSNLKPDIIRYLWDRNIPQINVIILNEISRSTPYTLETIKPLLNEDLASYNTLL
jgi:hypothetical protein